MHDYPWYKLLSDSTDELTQGDLIRGCPVVHPIANLENGENEIEATLTKVDGIILTQSCDIAQSKVDSVIICPFLDLLDFKEQIDKTWPQIKKELLNINTGKRLQFFLLNQYENENVSEDFKIVDFQNSYSVPIELLRKIASEQVPRLRLLPPYREKISRAYAERFSRIGLPIDITEEEIADRYRADVGLDTNIG